MEKKFICGNKYTISITNTIGLPVFLQNLPKEIEIEGNQLSLKSFHVSLVCINEIVRKYNVSISNFRDLIVKDFCDFTDENDIKLLNYREGFKFAAQNDLKTVVVFCEVSNINKFFYLMNEKYKLNIEYPPFHVTLYTLPSKVGIFLTDSDDIKKFTVTIKNPVGRRL